jgi:flagellar biosynthetic protein FlhB
MASSGGKTEQPTPQRLKKAREQGQFLSARGMVGGIQFVAMVVILHNLIPQWKNRLQTSMTKLLEHSITSEIGAGEWPVLLRALLIETMLPIGIAAGLVWLVTTGTHLGISKMGFSLQRLTPKFDRLNPIAKLREIPQQNLKSVIEAVLLLGVLSLSIHSLYSRYAEQFLRLPFQSVPSAVEQIGSSLEDMLWKAAGIFVIFGGIDLFRQYRKHMSTLRMSKEEIKEEHKRQEGDPHLKGRIRRLRRELLRKQMMRDVPQATAVVVNPTHFAVALRYELDSMSSPVCVAKGKNWLALRIREIAKEHDVPIVENPPLARALYDSLEVGHTIPPEFFKAVAEILAYIYRVMGQKLPG